jgi:hypothetical protein
LGENSTDTRPRAGRKSATTVHVSHSAIAHGNERQDMALAVAGHCVHGRKPNRIRRTHSSTDARQRVRNQATITSSTRMTSTNVT